MGIIQRFKDIMAANFNALLDKSEDPAKMVELYIRNLEEDLGKVKSETAAVMAEETRCKRELDECSAEIAKMQKYAEKAILAGNDADARNFLVQKNTLMEKQAGLQQAYEVAHTNADKMRQMHDKLTKDLASLRARKDAIKAKVQVAKTQERVNQIGSSISSASGSIAAFDRMEEKANRMLDQANAEWELNNGSAASIDDLALKYDMQATDDVDDELAALKAKLGTAE